MSDGQNDPTSYGWMTYAWVIGLSLLGGTASFLRKVKKGESRPFNVVELIGEITISALVGIVTFYFCEWANFEQVLTAAIIGVSSHMGSRAMMLFERALEERIKRGGS